MRNQKVTVRVDGDLLRRARALTGEGVTVTIRRGLQLVAATEAYERLRALRGKVSFSVYVQTKNARRLLIRRVVEHFGVSGEQARALRTELRKKSDHELLELDHLGRTSPFNLLQSRS